MSASVPLRPSTPTDTTCSHLVSTLTHSRMSQLFALQTHILSADQTPDNMLSAISLNNSRPSFLLDLPRTVESSTDLTRLTEPSGNLAMSTFATEEEKAETTTTFPVCSTPTSWDAGDPVTQLFSELNALQTPESAAPAAATLWASPTALPSHSSQFSQSSSLYEHLLNQT